MFLTDSEANAALDARFPGGPTRYLLLSLTEPVFANSGYTGISEPAEPSYARIEIPASDWPAASDRAVELSVAWPDAVDDLGDFDFWGLSDDPDAGVVSVAGRFASTIEIYAGTSNITLDLRVESPSNFIELI